MSRTTDIKPATISSWIKQTIRSSYTDPLKGVKAHQTRSASSSWAYASGASLEQVMEACFWRSSSMFTSFYFKDYWTSEVDADMHHLGPFVSAGMIVPAKDIVIVSLLAKY